MLAAGLDGIDRELDPGSRNDDNLYEVSEEELRERGIHFLPSTLSEACDFLEVDDVVCQALGQQYADYYLECKREEWREYHHTVTEWERRRYLPIF